VKFTAIPGGLRSRNLISQEAINVLTDCVWSKSPDIFTPKKLKPAHAPSCLDFEQVAMPMVHPTTGETISSYKKLMHDPATKDIWQRAFGKDFGGMAQGCNKNSSKNTNTACRNASNIAHTHRLPNNMVPKHTPPFQLTTPPKLSPEEIRKSNAS
jgi:hypothetical protein